MSREDAALTLDGLLSSAQAALEYSEDGVLVLRLRGIYRTDTRRLFGRSGGPRGRVVGTEIDEGGVGRSLVMFKAREVRDACLPLQQALGEMG